MAMTNGHSSPIKLDALIVGAGFGGCYLLNILRKEGLSTKVVEAGTTLGGVWSWNRYPGARVDVEVPYYGFSDPAIWGTYLWPERFPSDTELRRYFQHVDKVWGLSKDIELNTKVVEANFVNQSWEVTTSSGQVYCCKYFLACTGTSFKQYIPEWKGRDKFKGIMHHSSLWPEEPVDLTGKRIAIIGAGSTGVQVLQEAAKVATHVTQFIRTPNYALPMRQREVSEEEIYAYKSQFPHVFKALRNTAAGLPMEKPDRNIMDTPPEERKVIWDELWKRGGFNWSHGGFADVSVNKEANRIQYDYWVTKTRARMTDPRKKDLLAPLEPSYYIGTKRPSLEQDYYECADQPNVEITNSPITEFTENGIRTEEKTTDFDIVVICTGYDAVTGGLRTMGIKGRDGLDLDEKWSKGVSTHLGMMVNGFPNMYIVYGPQAPTSFTNGPPFIELQCEWIRDVITRQERENIVTAEASKEAEAAWRDGVIKMANQTLLVETNSWYMGANVPGKQREFLLYVGGLPAWKNACEDALEDWRGFQVQKAA
ncbi:Hypothetical protein R9X50_00155600 [Acrodontium crateriforme]|uniref:FAD/NAD(P)-binding domain-containing protein n=1 Tax=Acrodontium crateriforme TaxID=150365 RepID=A0AAQ3M292_9PEZI|nr:Hypothetical protein R9X50_00155600 [Acrodontium crateriforme]